MLEVKKIDFFSQRYLRPESTKYLKTKTLYTLITRQFLFVPTYNSVHLCELSPINFLIFMVLTIMTIGKSKLHYLHTCSM